nr:hypothetical protein [Baekduia alba]
MTIVITAFERSPDGGMGLARDTRVRWALEEVGQPTRFALSRFARSRNPRTCAFILSA